MGSNKRRSGCLTPDENTIFNHLELFRMLAKVRDRTRSPTLPFQPPKKNFAQLFDSTRERERERSSIFASKRRAQKPTPLFDPTGHPADCRAVEAARLRWPCPPSSPLRGSAGAAEHGAAEGGRDSAGGSNEVITPEVLNYGTWMNDTSDLLLLDLLVATAQHTLETSFAARSGTCSKAPSEQP